MKKKVKKYEWGTFSASGSNSLIVNPGNAALKQYKTTGEPTPIVSGDISQLNKTVAKKPSFMENYGGAIAQAAGTLMPLLMKKRDPNEKPYKKGTKNLNINMKKNNKFIKYDEGSDSLLNTAGPRMSNTPGENFGYTINPSSRSSSAKKTTASKPAMSSDMQKVARLQQKMKAAGYNIKVDGAWGNETQKIYDAYIKDKAADTSRKGTVNTGQGPTIQNAQNLKEARALGAKGTVLDQVNITAPAKKSYNQFDSPVLRGASADTQARMKQEQAAANARAKARQAEVAKNSQSLPSDTRANRFTFNAANKGQGTDVTAIQNEALKRNKLVGDGATSKNSSRVQTFGLGTMAAKLFGGNTSSAVPKMPSKLPNKMGSPMVKKGPSTPFNPMAAIKPTMPVDNRPGMEAVRNYKPAGPKRALPPIPKPMNVPTGPSMNIGKAIAKRVPSSSMPKLMYDEGVKKVSGYSKLDMKLGGLLPGGVSRAEYKAAKAEKENEKKLVATRNEAMDARKTYETRLDAEEARKTYETRLAAESARSDYEAKQKQAPATKSLKTQYEENKGGYARALKSGKKDAQGNAIDPNTGLAYKVLPTKTGSAGGAGKSGGTGAKTTAPKENPLFKNGVAVKNFKDPKTGRTFYTNGRVFDEKTGRMAKYSHDAKNKKVNLQWDKAKAAPKKKGDDTYMDEAIDIGSRTIGSIGGAALLGGSTFGAGSVAGAIGGDIAGKKFGNWLNKKLGYREENDASQEGYSATEGLTAGLGGGLAGRFAKPVGGALVKYVGKEAGKVAQAPIGRAISSIAKSKAGQAVGNVASKAKNAVTGGSKAAAQTTSQAASQGAKQSVKLVNAPGAMSKVAPTAQSSRAVGNLGKAPRMVQKGSNQYRTAQPNVKTSPKVEPNNIRGSFKKGEMPTIKTPASATSSPAASTAKAAQNTAKSSVSKTKAVARLARQKGKKAINYAQNNKKKVALGATGIGGLVGGGYALSQMRTSGE